MKPIDVAKNLYREHVPHGTFEKALAEYLGKPNGGVISTPKHFAMGEAVDYEGKLAWYIDTAVGKLSELITLVPFRLPYIAFSRGKRNGKLHIYPYDRFVRLIA